MYSPDVRGLRIQADTRSRTDRTVHPQRANGKSLRRFEAAAAAVCPATLFFNSALLAQMFPAPGVNNAREWERNFSALIVGANESPRGMVSPLANYTLNGESCAVH